MFEIIVLLVVFIIIIVLLTLVSLIIGKKERPEYQESIRDSYIPPEPSDKYVEPLNDKTRFSKIINTINNKFQPVRSKSEEDYENQLINFLKNQFKNLVIRRGHTRKGIRIDFVLEGTFAIDLITIDTEGKLVNLMTQISLSKEDFDKLCVVLIDLGFISETTINSYISQFRDMRVRVIYKKI